MLAFAGIPRQVRDEKVDPHNVASVIQHTPPTNLSQTRPTIRVQKSILTSSQNKQEILHLYPQNTIWK